MVTAVTAFDRFFAEQSQNSSTSTAAFFKTQMMFSLIQSSLISIFSGLIWVLGFYNLEDNKGRRILLAAFAVMLLTPLVNGVGSYTILDEWIAQGTFNTLFNSTSAVSAYSQMFPISQWTGITGVIMLLVSLVSYLLLFVALFIAYKRVSNTELTATPSQEDTYHL
jgi:hypothetical protein